jgi:hypothetical protein
MGHLTGMIHLWSIIDAALYMSMTNIVRTVAAVKFTTGNPVYSGGLYGIFPAGTFAKVASFQLTCN